jgi:hypothetical protein
LETQGHPAAMPVPAMTGELNRQNHLSEAGTAGMGAMGEATPSQQARAIGPADGVYPWRAPSGRTAKGRV